MEEKPLEENLVSPCKKKGEDNENMVDSATENEEYEVVTSISGEFLSGWIDEETSQARTENFPYDKSLESFEEQYELVDENWIESVRNDMKCLEHWAEQTSNVECNNVKENEAFSHCPLLRPHEYLPSTKSNHKDHCAEKHDFLPLEALLHKLSKSNRGQLRCLRNDERKNQRNIKNEDTYMQEVTPKLALENYCQQHAYSRARMLRTDRRVLINELLEQVNNYDEEEIYPHSLKSEPLLTSTEIAQHSKEGNDSPATTGENQGGNSHKIGRNDSKTPIVNRTMLRPGQTRNNGLAQRKEADDIRLGKCPVENMRETLKVTPCVLFPNEVSSDLRHRSSQRHKSLPRHRVK